MVLHFEPTLPCAQVNGDGTLCGVLTTNGVIAPVDGDVWELLPVCAAHYQAAVGTFGADVGRMTPTDVRKVLLALSGQSE